jgi:hypothetical protein
MSVSIPQSTAYVAVFKAYLASDHATEATGKTIAITISKAGGAFGNPAAGATNATEISSGWYKVSLGTGDTDTLGIIAIRGAVATIDDVGIWYNVVSATTGGATNLDAAITTRMATYTQPTGFLAATFPTTVASTTNITAGTITTATNVTTVNGLAAGVITNASIANNAINDAKVDSDVTIASVTGTIGGLTAAALKDFFDTDSTTTYGSAVSGSVVKEIADNAAGSGGPSAATIAAAVWDLDATGHQTTGTFGQAIGDPGADTDTIWALVNANLDATVSSRSTQTSVDDLPTNAELATALGTADDAVLAAIAALTIPSANANADALLDRADAIETGLTPRQAMRISAAADGGKLSGGATTTNTIRNAVADSKDRIIATVDADGNRTAITYDLT